MAIYIYIYIYIYHIHTRGYGLQLGANKYIKKQTSTKCDTLEVDILQRAQVTDMKCDIKKP